MYGINVHPGTGELFLFDAGSFSGNGKMLRYSANGTFIKEYETGIGPNNIAF